MVAGLDEGWRDTKSNGRLGTFNPMPARRSYTSTYSATALNHDVPPRHGTARCRVRIGAVVDL